MTTQNLTSQGAVQTASVGATDVQHSLQHGMLSCRDAFRRNCLDLNPDLVRSVDTMESGAAYMEGMDQEHWILADDSLRSMVASLAGYKRTLAYWQGGGERTESLLALEVVRELGFGRTDKPASVWVLVKFMTSFTVRCLSLSIRLQREIAAVKRQLRRAQVA